MKLSLKHLGRYKNQLCVSLKGKKFIKASDLSACEIRYLLRTAYEIKSSKRVPSYVRSLAGKTITFLLDTPCLRLQTSLHNASCFLKMPLNILVDSNWEDVPHPEDVGKLLSVSSDIIFCKADRQIKLEKLANGSTVPVINIASNRCAVIEILSNLLTLKEHFGYTKGLVIGWVGRPCPILNSYLTIAPMLDLQIKFLCHSCGGLVSPSDLAYVLSRGKIYEENIKEGQSLKDTIKGAHVIATIGHCETDNLMLTLTDLEKYADKNWVFLPFLPRAFTEVEENVFNSDRNLLWASHMNYKWICAALISRYLTN